jgi:hypothetical protein
MTLIRSVLMAALLALMVCGPAFAHGGARGGGHPGAAAGHGGGHPGQMPRQHQQQHITPEMQHQMMMEQFIYGPLLRDIWLQDQRAAARRKLAQPQPSPVPSQPKRRPGPNHTQRSLGANVATPATNQPHPPARRHEDKGRRDRATGLVQADPALVLPDQETSEPELTPQTGGLDNAAEDSQPTEPQETSEPGSENGNAEDQQPADPQPLSDAGNANGTINADSENNATSDAGSRRLIRAVVPESLQNAQDEEIVDLLKTIHAKLRGMGNRHAGRRDRALDQIASAFSQLYPWVTLPSAAAPDSAPPAQTDSDSILREALRDLSSVESSLSTMPDRAPRHEKAHAAVVAARKEMNEALGSPK